MDANFAHILEELKQKGVIDNGFDEVSSFSESSNSRVAGISKNGQFYFVIKVHRSEHVKAETQFLEKYKANPFTPQVIFIDPEYRYFVYQYIAGKRELLTIDKVDWLKALIANYINHYSSLENATWGYLDDPCPTYTDVLISDIHYWNIALQALKPEDKEMVLGFAQELGIEFKEEQFLVHGDPSIRNSLFKEGKLVAVLDPYPLVAPKIYDVLFAFCSNPTDLELGCLKESIQTLKGWTKDDHILYKHLLVNLYCRIGICLKHVPQDLSIYVKAWDYWKNFLHSM